MLFSTITFIFYPIVIIFWSRNVPEYLRGNAIFEHSPSGQMVTRLNELEIVSNVDILFLGSSHAYRSFDPRIFRKYGISSFNLGSSAQTPIQTNLLLKRYLERLSPKLVIYEVYPQTFCTDGIESSLDLISSGSIDGDLVKMVVKQRNVKLYNSLICGMYFNGLLHENRNEKIIVGGSDTYISGGYITREDINLNGPWKFQSQNWVFNETQFKVFHDNVELLREHGCEVVFVQAPYTKALYNSYRNNSQFDIRIQSYGRYYNYNSQVYLSDSLHFYDKDHLNQIGVTIFNEALITDLLN